jgi:hypothetical protein
VKQSLLGPCGTPLKGQKKISGERIGGALKSSGQRGWSKSWNWMGKLCETASCLSEIYGGGERMPSS